MDRARGEFIDLLTEVDEADDTHLPQAWGALVDCAAENFAREEAWMRASGHEARKDHAVQHHVVLDVMREGALQAGEGRLLQVRQMARQLRGWYGKHARTMDAALALHLRSKRIEPADAVAPPKPSPRVWTALREAVEDVASH
jgi:hemerythrin